MRRTFARRLRADVAGATVVEFAIVLPVMLLLIMGLSEFAYQSYVQAMLSGAMQKAGRDSTIQGSTAKTSAIDAAVLGVVRNVARDAAVDPARSSRKSYAQFGQIAPEQFDDNNGNGTYDKASECFTDVNGNGTWDADPGQNGQGGANDVVLYKLTLTYPSLFPLAEIVGRSAMQSVSATTILKNQPYASQNSYTATRICPP